jgi:hypothetical protein
MSTINLKTKEYIKQLEEENLLLKDKVLNNILNYNFEIIKLQLRIDILEEENKDLKRQNILLRLK